MGEKRLLWQQVITTGNMHGLIDWEKQAYNIYLQRKN
jgi:hypothetical protein